MRARPIFSGIVWNLIPCVFSHCSAEFRNVIDVSLRTVVVAAVEEMMGVPLGGGSQSPGVALAKLLPRVAQMGPLLLEEPSKNRFIQIIQQAPEVEIFFTLLYANIPSL